jgi:hypothetical protein
LAVELVVVVAAGFDVVVGVEVDVDVVVDVVCPMACNTVIRQITTAAVAIRFIAALLRDYVTAICRPMRALGAFAPADGRGRFLIGPSVTEITTLRR